MLGIVVGVVVGIIVLFIIIKLVGYAKKQHILEQKRQERQKVEDTIDALANNSIELTPDEFFEMRDVRGESGKSLHSLNYNFKGVYILHNKTKNMYYVGQAQKILNRVFNHFTGSGNGDVYADYKYGDEFTIRMISLEKSGYKNLDQLEYDIIQRYDANNSGYNKTSGNFSRARAMESIYELPDDNPVKKCVLENEAIRELKKEYDKYNKEQKLNAIKKLKEYVKNSNNTNWQLDAKTKRVNFFYLNDEFTYEIATEWWNNIPLSSAKKEWKRLPKKIIESIIEPAYRLRKIKYYDN